VEKERPLLRIPVWDMLPRSCVNIAAGTQALDVLGKGVFHAHSVADTAAVGCRAGHMRLLGGHQVSSFSFLLPDWG